MQKYKYVGIYIILMLLSVLMTKCNCHHSNSVKNVSDTTSVADIGNPQIKEITDKINEDPNIADNYFFRSSVYMTLKNYKAAYKDLVSATAIDSGNAKYYAAMGIACIKGNFFPGALDPLNRSLKIDPTNKEIRLSLAQSYFYLRDYQSSITQLHLLLDQDKKYSLAFFFEGMNFKEMGDTAKAIASFQNAVQVKPDYYAAYMELGLLCAAKKSPLAPQYFDDAIRLDTTSSEAYYAKGKYYQDMKDDPKAKRVYRQLIQKDPFNEHAFFNLGFIYLMEDSTKEAYKYFNFSIKVKPQYAEGYYYRGICENMLGNRVQALADMDEAIALKPDFEEAKEAYDKLQKQK